MQVSVYFFASYCGSTESTTKFCINLPVQIYNPYVTIVKRICNPYDRNAFIWTMTGL